MPQKPKLGQNFLVDADAVERIVAGLGDLAGRTVVEIGPGRGAITGALAGAGRPCGGNRARSRSGRGIAQGIWPRTRDPSTCTLWSRMCSGSILRRRQPKPESGCACRQSAVLHHLADSAQARREPRGAGCGRADGATRSCGARDGRAGLAGLWAAFGDRADVRASRAAVHAAALGIFAAAPGTFHGFSLAVCAAIRGAGRRRGWFFALSASGLCAKTQDARE